MGFPSHRLSTSVLRKKVLKNIVHAVSGLSCNVFSIIRYPCDVISNRWKKTSFVFLVSSASHPAQWSPHQLHHPALPPLPPSPSPSLTRTPPQQWLGSLQTLSTPAPWLPGTLRALDLLYTSLLPLLKTVKVFSQINCKSSHSACTQMRFFNSSWVEYYQAVLTLR